MPGLAFDVATGTRLGRGGGYYDAWARAAGAAVGGVGAAGTPPSPAPPLLVALAFRAQCVEGVPAGLGDVGVDVVVTADGIVGCSERGRAALRGG